MKLKILFCRLLLSGMFILPAVTYAQQQEPDEIALADDEFQNNFYEALKQKGIENYDRAIQSLQKCLDNKPNDAVIYNEIGKNYLFLKNYPEAEKAFLKATQLDPKNRWYWAGLYDVYYSTQNFNKSIPIVEKLTEFNKEYYEEDLVSLYMYTQQYDKALELINDLDETVGRSERREMYKLQILSSEKYRKPEKETLEQAIIKNPKEESNYIRLIYLYSESNQEEKAQEIAKKLEKEIPESDWAQVSLFKFHLNNNDGNKASESMFKVLKSNKIDKKIKHRILNEFLIFTYTNPSFGNDLANAITFFDDERDVNVNKEVGKFFFNKQDYKQSTAFFEKGLIINPDDIEGIELLLYSYNQQKQFEILSKSAQKYIELYPTHALLYYYAGLAQNEMKEPKKAKTFLESGIDFVVENIELEINFNLQLSKTWEALGDIKKKEAYLETANKLMKSKK